MDIWTILLILSMIIGPAGPHPIAEVSQFASRDCTVGEQYWKVFELPKQGVRILADESFDQFEDESLQPFIVWSGCRGTEIFDEVIIRSEEDGSQLFIAYGDSIFRLP